MTADNALELPQLRTDLQISVASNNHDGSQSWTIYDPLNHRFYRIGALVHHLLYDWALGNSAALIAKVAATTTFFPTKNDIAELIAFLHRNQLTVQSCTQPANVYLSQYQKTRTNIWQKLLQRYLFFRIPLLRPDVFLTRTYPFVRKLYAKTFLSLAVSIGLLGIYFVSRQWDVFLDTLLHFFTLEGAFAYALVLIGTKILHELGHAYTAKHYGCRIPSMGVAFMVMIPMCYSDMSDTWRLNDKLQRIHVAAAGMINELLLAGLCLCAWSFLPDGVMRSICFIIATTSIVTSLTINLTPFMRFDGYYMLADWWGVDNLQQRSFQLAQWKLRQLLFGAIEEKPEHFSSALELKLIAYAWATWFYRLVLFLGIALLVYHFFFKLLGLILFAVEVVFLIIAPIYKELTRWHALRNQIYQQGRIKVVLVGLVTLMGLLLFPWHTQIIVPGVLTTAHYASLYAPESAQIESIALERGQKVERDQIIMVLRSPSIDSEMAYTQKQLELLKLRASRAVTNRQDQEDLHVILEQIALEASKLDGLVKRKDRLVLRAPFAGVIVEMDPNLQPQQWLSNKSLLCFIIAPQFAEIKGVAPAHELNRIEIGQAATFFPEDPQQKKVTASVSRIDWGDIRDFDLTYFSSQYGGSIVAKKQKDGRMAPERTVYAIKLRDIAARAPERELRGQIVIEGKSLSLLRRFLEFVFSGMIRESGF